MSNYNFFYFDANGQKQGPLNVQQLQTLVDQGVILTTTLMETDAGHKGQAGRIPGLTFNTTVAPSSDADSVLSEKSDMLTIFWIMFGASSFLALVGLLLWFVLTLIFLPIAIVCLILAIKERNRIIVQELEGRSLRGDTQALHDLVGRYQQRGRFGELTQFLGKVAEEGHLPALAAAQYELGCCYMSGNGVEKDINHATHWFQKAAGHGHAGAQYQLGSNYYNGIGFEKNNAQAIFWLKKSSAQGHKDAADLALRIEREEAQRQKEEQIKNAASQGDPQAQFDWGDLLYQKNDYKQSVSWYQKSAEQGHAEAQYKLGTCYYNGLGFESNNTQAIFWLKKSSAQGHKDAGKLALQIEQEEAQRQKEEQMKNAASQGDPQAQFDWGDLLYQKKDYQQCVSWYRKAAEQGHSESQYRLADSYHNGIGITMDLDQAIYWAKKASEQGHKGAGKLALKVEEVKAASYDITLW